MVNVGDAAGDRVFDRDHAEFGLAAVDRGKCVFEGRARHRLVVRIGVARGEVGVRSRFALEHDLLGCRHGVPVRTPPRRVNGSYVRVPDTVHRSPGLRPCLAPPEDCARPLELRGRVDAERHAVDDDRVDAHPRFERAQLLEFFALLERRRRSEPETWSPRVITARPPAFSTQAATTSESVATTTSPSRAACARRSTWTIIGSPAMSSSGLPGSLVEAMRAGMTMRTSAIAAPRPLGL